MAHSNNNEWELSLWLMPQDGIWKVNAFHLDASGVADRGVGTLWTLAKEERRAGHAFNAGILYGTVRELLKRGPWLQLGVARAFDEDARTLPPLAELQGPPPFHWRLGGATYEVAGISPIATEGMIGLSFGLPQIEWPATEGVIASNHAFLSAFMAAYPEVPKVFGYLVARAVKPDRSGGYATVYEYGRGFND
ncbi:MAG TPA: hypothetical protein VHJ20_06750 [Polyangia bacterium]|nr:hypothetical protein [Polyangia bacterium]